MASSVTRESAVCAVPEPAAEAARREHPLLRGLLAVAAGFSSAPPAPAGRGTEAYTLLYCIKGRGWCELQGRPQPVRAGDILLLPPGAAPRCSGKPAGACAFLWVRGVGPLLPEYFQQLDAASQPLLRIGEDPRLVRLFNEIREALRRGPGFAALLQAAQGLGYLLALLIGRRREHRPEDPDTSGKIAAAIIYMSEHLGEPLRVAALARSAGLSPAWFTELFRSQAGCTPREYLRLLRMHRACQLLQGTAFTIKEIAQHTGYPDPFHFSRQFKAFQGQSPSDYRGCHGRVRA